MSYDALNRVRTKTYSGTTPEGTAAANLTPPVNYFYATYTGLLSGAPSWAGAPSKGRLVGVTYGSGSEGTYYKYDAAGRILTNHQRQGSSNYATTYAYNLAGGVTFEQRGNYFRNSWTYDGAGRIRTMDASFTPFLSSIYLVREINYTPSGALQSERYGNGLIHSMAYNARLQPTEIRLGRADNLESVFRIGYIYGTANDVNAQDAEITSAHNNGNIARIKYVISGTVQYTQTFQYDALNRLGYAVEHNNGALNEGARAWYQTFEYDRYGNRGINVANTSDNVDGGNTALQLGDFSGANNRITRPGYAYDACGNLIGEPGKSYTYDGENRLVMATVGGVTSQYVYEGNGRRVKKIVGGVATRFEYGAGEELIAERSEASGSVTKGYVYKGGELLATTTNGTAYQYATADHLGSPRAWTDDAGNLVAGGRHDYGPFGEELSAGVGIRSAALGYGADSTRQKFGSKERDIETGLDYFIARYYSNIQGRFTSVDPENAGAVEDDPQSWNGYAYARGNPVLYSDPDGRKYLICAPDGKECYEHSDEQFVNGRRTGRKDGFTFTGDGKFYEKGKILDKDGNVIATYEQISIDDRANELAFHMQAAFREPDLYRRAVGNAISSATFGVVFGGLKTSGIRINTTSPTRSAALREAKLANNIPISKQPDRVIKPNTDEGRAAGLRPGDNVRLYEYTNSRGQKIWIREDRAISYGSTGGRGDQGPHFNSGPKGEKLTNHHYWRQ